jgi:hypothetical protein
MVLVYVAPGVLAPLPLAERAVASSTTQAPPDQPALDVNARICRRERAA